ncbi:Uma2 family endonuclease [Streptomyces sp. DSM 41982]|uniref:Uma2 family endonuclease n=1 Tax=Streptomyces evansiae TaxID=3075535 RepID=A0ABD5EDV9_9ACTN|nr:MULTISPECIES: Uma2 family endonuclease [unclassified Streptomyces]MDT0418772.1 Uma2 family endonuclease [Streptomyces sp. DSM 41982]SCE37279.1 Endonuclease, Uma2 family (restriction endonuclease fold) [Streptomyces sp. SolWspMP-sol7th]
MSVAMDHTGPWTVADVLALPEDRTVRHELLGESLVVSRAPRVRHQRASLRLATLLAAAAVEAKAPVEVLEAVNVLIPSGLCVPDIVVVDVAPTDDDPVALDADVVHLAVEVVSPGNSAIDRKVKPLLYAEAAIPHFWRLELAPAPMLVVYELEDGRYQERLTALSGTTTSLTAPFRLDVDPATFTWA